LPHRRPRRHAVAQPTWPRRFVLRWTAGSRNQSAAIQEEDMSAFNAVELAYLQSQKLGRLATAGADSQPHVVPVTFRYNPVEDSIDIGGHGGFAKRKKYRDVTQNPRVAFVIDDLASVDPWAPRGLEIRGIAEVLSEGGKTLGPGFDQEMFRIRPKRIISWGLEGKGFQQNARSVP
jgi:pyridoxamine 5'-phosphate oxidase family protein